MRGARPLSRVPVAVPPVRRFVQEVFATLTRAEQRRWAEVYVRGLLFVPGRKSIPRIAGTVVDRRVEQSLQQFVNQSPWRWEPVRRDLAHRVAAGLRPHAWVVEEVVLPKNGTGSVGVANQRAHSLGRALNCQLGLAVFLRNDERACAVNWRLFLPKSWGDDPARRARARVPDGEVHRPRRHHLFDALDEMTGEWGLPPAPVLLDGRAEPRLDALLDGLESRRLTYVVRVGAESVGRVLPVRPVLRTARYTVSAPLPDRPGPVPPTYSLWRPRRVLTAWSPDRRRPLAAWLTNAPPARLPELVRTIEPAPWGEHLNQLYEDYGLRHFEGRSFTGWHHHVTLVAAAHAHHELRRAEGRPACAAVLPRNA
ncbi:transposase [Actinosynnema sp. NPDC020468]|uniref:IS701 family transposase n=1 Tax=Actinosynnema sp. NPDC020468 TaxID=3154488 RepID=UPI0033FC4B25